MTINSNLHDKSISWPPVSKISISRKHECYRLELFPKYPSNIW